MWHDGICKICRSLIEEDINKDKFIVTDYRNRCSNAKCVHHTWHYVKSTEELDYYKHNR